MWSKLVTTPNTFVLITNRIGTSATPRGFRVSIGSSGSNPTLVVVLQDSVSNINLPVIPYQDYMNKWTHIMFSLTRSGSSAVGVARVYLNGTLVSTANVVSSFGAVQPIPSHTIIVGASSNSTTVYPRGSFSVHGLRLWRVGADALIDAESTARLVNPAAFTELYRSSTLAAAYSFNGTLAPQVPATATSANSIPVVAVSEFEAGGPPLLEHPHVCAHEVSTGCRPVYPSLQTPAPPTGFYNLPSFKCEADVLDCRGSTDYGPTWRDSCTAQPWCTVPTLAPPNGATSVPPGYCMPDAAGCMRHAVSACPTSVNYRVNSDVMSPVGSCAPRRISAAAAATTGGRQQGVLEGSIVCGAAAEVNCSAVSWNDCYAATPQHYFGQPFRGGLIPQLQHVQRRCVRSLDADTLAPACRADEFACGDVKDSHSCVALAGCSWSGTSCIPDSEQCVHVPFLTESSSQEDDFNRRLILKNEDRGKVSFPSTDQAITARCAMRPGCRVVRNSATTSMCAADINGCHAVSSELGCTYSPGCRWNSLLSACLSDTYNCQRNDTAKNQWACDSSPGCRFATVPQVAKVLTVSGSPVAPGQQMCAADTVCFGRTQSGCDAALGCRWNPSAGSSYPNGVCMNDPYNCNTRSVSACNFAVPGDSSNKLRTTACAVVMKSTLNRTSLTGVSYTRVPSPVPVVPAPVPVPVVPAAPHTPPFVAPAPIRGPIPVAGTLPRCVPSLFLDIARYVNQTVTIPVPTTCAPCRDDDVLCFIGSGTECVDGAANYPACYHYQLCVLYGEAFCPEGLVVADTAIATGCGAVGGDVVCIDQGGAGGHGDVLVGGDALPPILPDTGMAAGDDPFDEPAVCVPATCDYGFMSAPLATCCAASGCINTAPSVPNYPPADHGVINEQSERSYYLLLLLLLIIPAVAGIIVVCRLRHVRERDRKVRPLASPPPSARNKVVPARVPTPPSTKPDAHTYDHVPVSGYPSYDPRAQRDLPPPVPTPSGPDPTQWLAQSGLGTHDPELASEMEAAIARVHAQRRAAASVAASRAAAVDRALDPATAAATIQRAVNDGPAYYFAPTAQPAEVPPPTPSYLHQPSPVYPNGPPPAALPTAFQSSQQPHLGSSAASNAPPASVAGLDASVLAQLDPAVVNHLRAAQLAVEQSMAAAAAARAAAASQSAIHQQQQYLPPNDASPSGGRESSRPRSAPRRARSSSRSNRRRDDLDESGRSAGRSDRNASPRAGSQPSRQGSMRSPSAASGSRRGTQPARPSSSRNSSRRQ